MIYLAMLYIFIIGIGVGYKGRMMDEADEDEHSRKYDFIGFLSNRPGDHDHRKHMKGII